MNDKTPRVPLFAGIKDADPVVVAASGEARQTLPRFLDAVEKKRFPKATHLVKVPLIDRSDTDEQALVGTSETMRKYATRPLCHLWLLVTEAFEHLIFASVGEAPDALNLKRDESFVIEASTVEDWLINHEGIGFGEFTLRVIRGRLSNDEQLNFDTHTGIREFRTLLQRSR